MSPPVFRKPPGTLLVSSTSCKCHGGKLNKKPLLLTAAGYPQPESPWYLAPVRAWFFDCTSHRALQGTKPPRMGPRLAAGFGRGRCLHPSPRGGRDSRLQDLALLTPCSCEAAARGHRNPSSHNTGLCASRKLLLSSSFASGQ